MVYLIVWRENDYRIDEFDLETHFVRTVRIMLGLQTKCAKFLVLCPTFSSFIQIERCIELDPWFCAKHFQKSTRRRMLYPLIKERGSHFVNLQHIKSYTYFICILYSTSPPSYAPPFLTLKIVYGHKLYILRSYFEYDDIHIKISVSRTILIKRQLIPCHVFLPASFSKAVVVIIPDTTGHREDYLPYVLFCAQVPCRSLDVGNIP